MKWHDTNHGAELSHSNNRACQRENDNRAILSEAECPTYQRGRAGSEQGESHQINEQSRQVSQHRALAQGAFMKEQQKTSLRPGGASKRGRPKEPQGLAAVLEAISGQSPCPELLRNAANKYLKDVPSESIFPKPAGFKGTWTNLAKLAQPGARILLENALQLDELFQGDTTLVRRIVNGKIPERELAPMMERATRTIDQRADIYNYWRVRISGVWQMIAKGGLDFRTQRLRDHLDLVGNRPPAAVPQVFALHALQVLELSERRARQGTPTATMLTEQAEAYLALGDLITASAKAREATAAEPNHARAWFLRVIAALKLRRQALGQVQRHRLEAEEADPASAHEQMARHQVEGAAGLAQRCDGDLNRLLPEALLHWPASKLGHAYHREWRIVVIEQFVQYLFRRFADRRNLQKLGSTTQPTEAWDTKVCERDRDALEILFKEHTRYSSDFWLGCHDSDLTLDLRLLHLRWLAGDIDYDGHRSEWILAAKFRSATVFEASILRNDALSAVWSFHHSRGTDAEAAQDFLMGLQTRDALDTERRQGGYQLREHVLSFDRMFAGQNYAGGWQICDMALDTLARSDLGKVKLDHPFNENATIPAGKVMYWRYLQALCAVLARKYGLHVYPVMQAMLDRANHWRDAFRQPIDCFWQICECDEDAADDEYEAPPYGFNLTLLSNWEDPVRECDLPFTNFDVHHVPTRPVKPVEGGQTPSASEASPPPPATSGNIPLVRD